MDPKYHKGGSSSTQSLKMCKGCNNLGPALHGYMISKIAAQCRSQWCVAGTTHQSAEVFGEYGGRQRICNCLSFLI